MQEKIVIILSGALSDPPIAMKIRGDEAEIAKTYEDKEVIVLLPSEDILLTSAKIPKMNRSKLMQALPFALEEQLISDVDQLHFAIAEFQNDSLPVAIVAREKMKTWLNQLQDLQIKTDTLCPNVFALPQEENVWHIVIEKMAIVRTGKFAGFNCDPANLEHFLQLALNENEMPRTIHIHNYTGVKWADQLAIDVEVKEEFKDETQLHVDLAKQIIQTPFINLLQGSYQTKRNQFPQKSKLLKTAIALSFAWIILLFSYPITSYWMLSKRVNGMQQEINVIYKRHFPQATSIVAPKQRLEGKLRKLTAENGENHLLLMLGKIGKGIAEIPNIKLNRFDFQSNQLNLDLTAASAEDFSAFTDFLQKQNLSVKQQNANLDGARINATLLIGS